MSGITPIPSITENRISRTTGKPTLRELTLTSIIRRAGKKRELINFLSDTLPRDLSGMSGRILFSEPETQAIAAFTENHSFRLILAYHAQGQLIFWKYKNYNPPNSYQIALEFAEVSGYTISETPPEMGNAGYKDWFIQEYNLPGYTIEVGLGANPLPISQFNEIYKDNVGILTIAPLLA